MTPYPKRLIEVDLPIKRISAQARREKSIRHGHISTLHIWWARRPLAACRAVICAALWPDPADDQCPPVFRQAAAQAMNGFAQKVMADRKLAETASEPAMGRWNALTKEKLDAADPGHWNVLRFALLDFIADFANWDNSTVPAYLETSRALTQAAHEALGGLPGTRPLVVDPFAGGGAIPLEALRVGADAFASDLNPVAVLLNKVVLEYIPTYGQRLADEVRRWGAWVKEQAENELAEFYPPDPDGATPIAYLWARTITCEGPGCGAEVPLMRSLWLAKRRKGSVALRLIPNRAAKRVDFAIIENAQTKDVGDGTVARGAATCPCCGYTTPVESVRTQLKSRRGGAFDPRLFAVVTARPDEKGRFFRTPEERDGEAICKAQNALQQQIAGDNGGLSLIPDEKLDIRGIRHTWAMTYGIESWGDLFTFRQVLSLITLAKWARIAGKQLIDADEVGLSTAVETCLALILDRQANTLTSLSRWNTTGEKIEGVFARQALPIVWDFGEGNPFSDSTGSFAGAIDWVVKVCDSNVCLDAGRSQVQIASATSHPLADDMVNLFFTDPPYYDAVAYAYLSDFFYVWLRRTLFDVHPQLFQETAVPKDNEIIVDRTHSLVSNSKDIAFYERELQKAFAEGHRVLRADGIGSIVFASKTTSSWEAILKAVIDAGWTITGSWPIDTEMQARVAGMDQARLASSIHIVCRPRETNAIGDWREVLQELPGRIHAWLPRLAQEGVVGADAIFACLGPALEIFSRYGRVEKASGEVISLSEYLETVWAAVSREALNLVFAGADTTGFEADARLTAMWLWTLSRNDELGIRNYEEEEEGEERVVAPVASAGYVLEYDAARKIAQGLGAHLEQLTNLVEIKGSNGRLLPVRERTRYLFGRDGLKTASRRPAKTGVQQLSLLDQLPEAEAREWRLSEETAVTPGQTMLDRVHQAMLLFGDGRSDALKQFLVTDGVGQDAAFWRLAQALSALYPPGSEEKRWVDGVHGRRKGLGF